MIDVKVAALKIAQLNAQELYESAELIGSFLVAWYLKAKDNNPATANVLVLYADSLFGLGKFQRAAKYYRVALRTNRGPKASSHRTRSRETAHRSSGGVDSSSAKFEVKVRYKIHKCFMKLQDFRAALAVLEKIPVPARTAYTQIAMARLYKNQGVSRSAVRCYKEALLKNPY